MAVSPLRSVRLKQDALNRALVRAGVLRAERDAALLELLKSRPDLSYNKVGEETGLGGEVVKKVAYASKDAELLELRKKNKEVK